jgi:hypothetical protein
MFPKLALVRVLDLRKPGPVSGACRIVGAKRGERTNLVKVILVELANEGCKVGMLEHPWEDGLCELIHVLSREIRDSNFISVTGVETTADLDYKAVPIGAPRYYSLE